MEFKIVPMKRSEIQFAVFSYGEMLKEVEKIEECDLIYSERNLETCKILLEHHYNIGHHCFSAETQEGVMIGCAAFLENVTFDIKGKVFCGFFLYVEPEYRNNGVATKLIESVLEYVKSVGARKFHCSFFQERQSSQKVIDHFGFKVNGSQVMMEFK